jgi:CRISPR-associated protein Cas1
MFEIRFEEETKRISPQRITSIVITNAANITTDAIQLALEHNIDIVFLDQYGEPYGRVWFPRLGSTTLIRRKMLEMYMLDEGFDFVKKWMLRKAQNQYDFIHLLLSKRPEKQEKLQEDLANMNKLLEKLIQMEGKLSELGNVIMGMEGSISRYYFKFLSLLLPDKYQFSGRSSRPAKDVFNACLNYGYGIMYGKVEKALVIAGLDPYIGLLHTDNYNKKSFVYDFIEPYRILIDQPVFYLFSRHKITDEHYSQIKDGVTLNDAGKKLLVPALLEHFDEIIRYGNKNRKRIDQIQADAHAFANFLIGKKDSY